MENLSKLLRTQFVSLAPPLKYCFPFLLGVLGLQIWSALSLPIGTGPFNGRIYCTEHPGTCPNIEARRSITHTHTGSGVWARHAMPPTSTSGRSVKGLGGFSINVIQYPWSGGCSASTWSKLFDGRRRQLMRVWASTVLGGTVVHLQRNG